MKKFFRVCITLIFFILSFRLVVFAETGPRVRINNGDVVFPDAQPFINGDGRTMVPVRFITENMGFTVAWDATARTVDISKDQVSILLKIDDYITYKTIHRTANEIKSWEEMDTNAVINDGRTFVPLRFVSEIMGYKVAWNGTTKTVQINSEYQSAGYIVPYGIPIAVTTYDASDITSTHNADVFIVVSKQYDVLLQKRLVKQILESKFGANNDQISEILAYVDGFFKEDNSAGNKIFTLKGRDVYVNIGYSATNIVVYKEK